MEFAANMLARHIYNDPKSIGQGLARKKGIDRKFTMGPQTHQRSRQGKRVGVARV
jgi:hypothetical protein